MRLGNSSREKVIITANEVGVLDLEKRASERYKRYGFPDGRVVGCDTGEVEDLFSGREGSYGGFKDRVRLGMYDCLLKYASIRLKREIRPEDFDSLLKRLDEDSSKEDGERVAEEVLELRDLWRGFLGCLGVAHGGGLQIYLQVLKSAIRKGKKMVRDEALGVIKNMMTLRETEDYKPESFFDNARRLREGASNLRGLAYEEKLAGQGCFAKRVDEGELTDKLDISNLEDLADKNPNAILVKGDKPALYLGGGETLLLGEGKGERDLPVTYVETDIGGNRKERFVVPFVDGDTEELFNSAYSRVMMEVAAIYLGVKESGDRVKFEQEVLGRLDKAELDQVKKIARCAGTAMVEATDGFFDYAHSHVRDLGKKASDLVLKRAKKEFEDVDEEKEGDLDLADKVERAARLVDEAITAESAVGKNIYLMTEKEAEEESPTKLLASQGNERLVKALGSGDTSKGKV